MNILFTNAGRRTYFIEFAIQIVKSNQKIKIYVSDCDSSAPTLNLSTAIKNILTPRVISNEDEYYSFLKSFIFENKIDLLIPLSDLDLLKLSEKYNDLIGIGCTPLVSSKELIENCLNKVKFINFCKNNNFNSPKLLKIYDADNLQMPIVCKKILGSGSNDLKFIRNIVDLNNLNDKDFIYQPLIKGKEYHLDILNDFNGNYISHCIKEKVLMRAGETDKAFTVYDKSLDDFAKIVSLSTKHKGNLDCDIIVDDQGKIFCIDFNPRFGGGYPFTHLAGMNYLKAIIDLYLGSEINLPEKPNNIFASKGISMHKVNR